MNTEQTTLSYQDQKLKDRATQLLKQWISSDAEFKPGQLEAIFAVMNHQRTLIVEKTGWGKSLVYFICCKLLQEQGHPGITMVISPLLALMNNQIATAQKYGINAVAFNSNITTKEKSQAVAAISRQISEGNFYLGPRVDMVYTTPETLQSCVGLSKLPISLLVIDEVHCISDWGHDFRPEYRKIAQSFAFMPQNSHVLGVTATANQNVIEDLKEQISGFQSSPELYIQQGPLERKNLFQEVINFNNNLEKMAWLAENVPQLYGSGIIYCNTVPETKMVSAFLQNCGVKIAAFHGQFKNHEEDEAIESAFYNDRITCLAATCKLGMGYDKGNISYVIHFNCPKNIISYYQEIGRAGRNLPNARVIMLFSPDDIKTLRYFNEHSFPEKQLTINVWEFLQYNGPCDIPTLLHNFNVSRGDINKVIDYLEAKNVIQQSDKASYFCNGRVLEYDEEHVNLINARHDQELQEMINLASYTGCITAKTLSSLNQKIHEPCNHCSNCCPEQRLKHNISHQFEELSKQYFMQPVNTAFAISPRKKDDNNEYLPNLEKVLATCCLSSYGSVGFAAQVSHEKYNAATFSQQIEDLVCTFAEQHFSYCDAIAYVPSLNHAHIPHLAVAIAQRMNIRLLNVFLKNPSTTQQKQMKNSSWQKKHAEELYSFNPAAYDGSQHVLLLDDFYDSGWTISTCAHLLAKFGCQLVQPLTLAQVGKNNNN